MVLAKGELQATSESTGAVSLSQDETRQILTPFAFDIDKSLFGIPLASPTKRALAILIDLLFVAFLSSTPGEVLALVIAITLYRLGSKQRALKLGKQKGFKRRKFLRFIAFFIVFVVLLEFLPSLFSSSVFENDTKKTDVINISESSLSTSQAIAFSALSGAMLLTVNNSECIELTCWQNELSPLVKEFSSFHLKDKVLEGAVEEIAEATKLVKVEQIQLEKHLVDVYHQAIQDDKHEEVQDKQVQDEQQEDKLSVVQTVSEVSTELAVKEKRPVYSIIEFVKGLIEDLGLGFGWAAFYFTVFTALWYGQTPGKKILGIRVLQLDGTPLSMWDSFGRYGGYGAGLATGLLGFIQIFWNANRQAIQDQISATVVIDDRKKAKLE